MTDRGDLQAFQDRPRLAGLAVSPDGKRLVTTVATPEPARTRFRTALWEVDPAGERAARRLTRGTGESAPAFLPDGDLLFTSARTDPEQAEPGDDAPAALWRLPPTGEAHVVGTRAGGIGPPHVARHAGTVVVAAKTLPGAVTEEDDAARRAARKERKIGAILHAAHPVRHWDHDLGPDEERLLAGTVPPDSADGADGAVVWCDLTPAPARALGAFAVAPDGAAVVAEWAVPERGGGRRVTLVVVDIASGERRVLLDDPAADVRSPAISADGTRVACVRETRSTATAPIDRTLLVVPLAGGAAEEVAPGWDRWPEELCWVGDALHVTTDDAGRRPVFRVTPDVVRLTGDDGCYADLVAAPDGGALYALRSAVDAPPAPVRLDPATPDQRPVPLPGPAEPVEPPGTLTEVTATAADGTPLRAWLALPEGDGRSPLLLWIHGGPLGSWNAWQWRWNPWLMTARGYAVLLPDPALSTGYGRAFVARGWGAWGDAPYTDLMALTDAATAHPRVDADAVAAMGGSFGGYMANWVAGHTDRFRAIVTHASLWALDGFGRTTDEPAYWRRELTPEMTARNSPHRHVEAITTPMLVVHGDKDYRVPIGEGLALWWDLVAAWGGEPAAMPHRFLYFPDENHWVLTPQHAVLWYETVLAFLDHHVRGAAWVTPELLR